MPIPVLPTTADTADLVIKELEDSAKDLFNYGNHEGECTNAAQKALYQHVLEKLPQCKKHQKALADRRKRFENALDQIKLLRGMEF